VLSIIIDYLKGIPTLSLNLNIKMKTENTFEIVVGDERLYFPNLLI